MGLLQYGICRNIYFLPLCIWSISKGLLALLACLIFKGRKWVFSQKKRDARPDCLNDPQLGIHKFIKVTDVKLHVVESGDPKKPLMLFLHGFPECWYAWRHQIREFNKEYHCVAFDMRGVGESEGPPGITNYTIDKLSGDVRELIKAMGHSSCDVLVGHDWGGNVTWDFVARYPEMVDKHIVMNIPHPDRFAELLASSLPQMLLSWYMFFFQLPYLPEILMSMGDYFGLESFPSNTDEDVEAFKFSLSRPGRITTFLHYYRHILKQLFAGTGTVTVPTLLIWGTGDTALHVKLSHDTEKFCPNLTVKRIEGGQHFIQQDKPDAVHTLMREFL